MTQNEVEKEVLEVCSKPCEEKEVYNSVKGKFPALEPKKFHDLILSMVFRNSLQTTPDWKLQKANI